MIFYMILCKFRSRIFNIYFGFFIPETDLFTPFRSMTRCPKSMVFHTKLTCQNRSFQHPESS